MKITIDAQRAIELLDRMSEDFRYQIGDDQKQALLIGIDAIRVCINGKILQYALKSMIEERNK